jgi:hypothetical protein
MYDSMTKKEWVEHLNTCRFDLCMLELHELLEDLTNSLYSECIKYTKTGAIDPESNLYKDRPTALAKVLLTAALDRHRNDYAPPTKEMQNDVHNLMQF